MAGATIGIGYCQDDRRFSKMLYNALVGQAVCEASEIADCCLDGQDASCSEFKTLDVLILLVSVGLASSEPVQHIVARQIEAMARRGQLKVVPVLLNRFNLSGAGWLEAIASLARESQPVQWSEDATVTALEIADRIGLEYCSVGNRDDDTNDDGTNCTTFGHLFISYSSRDGDFADVLNMRLENAGHITWIDTERLIAGKKWRSDIDNAIREAAAVIVVMSPNAKQSEYVTYEWAYAWGANVTIIPLLLLPTELHPRLESLQYLDFTKRDSRPWRRLLDVISELQEGKSERGDGRRSSLKL